ncbi:MAG: hypothetical protein ACTSYU_11245 [Promethearchaeota archaeon]
MSKTNIHKRSRKQLRFKRMKPTRFSDKLNHLQHLNLFQVSPQFQTMHYRPQDYFSIFLSAGLSQNSLKSSAWCLKQGGFNIPSSEQLMKKCREIPDNEVATLVNGMLRMWYRNLSAKFRRQLQMDGILLIDFHQDPYYGDPENPDIVRGKVKKSTTLFYEYLTAQVYSKHGSQTIALILRRKKIPIAEHVKELMDNVLEVFSPKLIVFDGEFANFNTLTLFNTLGIPFLGRKSKTGRIKSAIEGITSVEGWRKQRTWQVVNMRGRKSRIKTIPIDISPQMVHGKVKVLCKSPELNLSVEEVEQIYQRRFSIETGYRDQHIVRPHIKSKVRAIRFLIFMIAILIWNVWQFARWDAGWVQDTYKKWRNHKLIQWTLRNLIKTAMFIEIGGKKMEKSTIGGD